RSVSAWAHPFSCNERSSIAPTGRETNILDLRHLGSPTNPSLTEACLESRPRRKTMLHSRCRSPQRARHPTAVAFTLAILLGGAAAAQSGPVLTGRLDTPRGMTGTASAYGTYLSGDTVKVVAHGSVDADGTFVVPLAASIDSALLNPVDAA